MAEPVAAPARSIAASVERVSFTVRRAHTSDVPVIHELVEPLVQRRILLGKDRVVFYEALQEFRVAVDAAGEIVGCGALHVIWDDLAEVRTLAVRSDWLRRGVGHALLEKIEEGARELGITKLFCLTFETEFFGGHGFEPIGEDVVPPDVFAQLTLSPDEGVAEFLDLAHVKPNTLGNTRMLKQL